MSTHRGDVIDRLWPKQFSHSLILSFVLGGKEM